MCQPGNYLLIFVLLLFLTLCQLGNLYLFKLLLLQNQSYTKYWYQNLFKATKPNTFKSLR